VSTPDLRHLSWIELDAMIDYAIAEMVKRHYYPERIVPVARGGIIPAAILYYKLLARGRVVRMLPAVICTSYDSSGNQSEIRSVWSQEVDIHIDAIPTLFVDEICDTGATIKHIRQKMPQSQHLVLVTKNDVPDFYATKDTRKYWWVFPWETK
jgi:hypoxanthine phosphoribosyltransferase